MEVRNGESAAAQGDLINVEDLSVDFRGGGKVTHGAAGLDIEASAVKADALADDSHFGRVL